MSTAMHLLDRVENALMALSEALFARWPRSCPGSERLKHCRIVAHRGEHDNRRTFENTLAAFDAAVAAVRDDVTNRRLRIAIRDDVDNASQELAVLDAQEMPAPQPPLRAMHHR